MLLVGVDRALPLLVAVDWAELLADADGLAVLLLLPVAEPEADGLAVLMLLPVAEPEAEADPVDVCVEKGLRVAVALAVPVGLLDAFWL